MLFEQLRRAARWARRSRTKRILAHAVNDVDAFLVSYPKSGRTWLRYILSCYFAQVADLGFMPDLQTTFRVNPNFDRNAQRGLPAFVGRNAGRNGKLPLIAVSHREFDARFFSSKPIVFLVRDTRDVVVSAFFHETRHKHRFTGKIGEFIEHPNFGIQAIAAYHNGWAQGLEGVPSLVVSYEEMSVDTAHTLDRILRFLGQTVDKDALNAAIERASFDHMQKVEERSGIPGHDYDRSDTESLRVRKGKVGGFSDYLSDAEANRVLELCREHYSPQARMLMAQSGLPL